MSEQEEYPTLPCGECPPQKAFLGEEIRLEGNCPEGFGSNSEVYTEPKKILHTAVCRDKGEWLRC